MSRRRAAPAVARNHVFPFLAVLICTMGALVTLLVVIAQLSHAAGAEAGAARRIGVASNSGDDETLWRLAQLETSREQTADDLQRAKLELSHLEDHLRRLRDRLADLRASAESLADSGPSSPAAQAEAESRRLRAAIAAAERSLDDAKRDAANRQPSYAVVPYVGPNGTRRRPIYLECRADAIILRPEGVEFTAADFTGPLGPGNPLASATRAVREFWASEPAGLDGGEPYPFLLVRPDGIIAYAIARKALSSWGAEFGYEFIDEDWQVDYPAADQRLADVARVALSVARREQQALVLAAPRHYGSPRLGGRSTSGSGSPGFAGIGGSSAMSGGGSGGGGGIGGGSSVNGSNGGSGAGSEFVHARGERSGGALTADASGGSFRFAEKPGGGASAARGRSGGSGGDGVSGNETGLAAVGAKRPDNDPHEPSLITDPELASTQASPPEPHAAKSGVVQSFAHKRGRDWGLPEARQGATAVTRPILVQCWTDKLIVASADGRGGKEIALPANTPDAVDELVASVWQQVKTWGIAGRGFYWRPTLTFDVLPGAEGRYEDLRVLLAESGLDVARRETPAPETRAAGVPGARR